MTNETTTYEGGSKLPAGWISTAIVPLAADTYYQGMLLAYKAPGTATADGDNTGNGTVTDVEADSTAMAGSYTLTMTGALEAKLTDPSGAVVADNINLVDGDETTVKVAGITMTITDGETAFEADDEFTIVSDDDGAYEARAAGSRIDAIYFGDDERELSSAGNGQVIVAGEIGQDGLVDDAGDALTITDDLIALMSSCGFEVKNT